MIGSVAYFRLIFPLLLIVIVLGADVRIANAVPLLSSPVQVPDRIIPAFQDESPRYNGIVKNKMEARALGLIPDSSEAWVSLVGNRQVELMPCCPDGLTATDKGSDKSSLDSLAPFHAENEVEGVSDAVEASESSIRITVIRVDGEVTVSTSAGKTTPLIAGEKPATGSIITTGKCSTLDLRLSTGTTVRVGPESAVSIRDTADGEDIIELVRGRVIAVPGDSSASGELRFITSSASVKSSSGVFYVETLTSEYTSVGVRSGSVHVSGHDAAGEGVMLGALRKTVVRPGQVPKYPVSLTQSELALFDAVADILPSGLSPSVAAASSSRISTDSSTKTDPLYKGKITSDVYGSKSFLHPFVSAGITYSDNVYNEAQDKKADWSYMLSPGIWMSLPRVNKILLDLNTSSRSPGGQIARRMKPESFRRYQLFLYYRADIERFSRYSDADMVSHRLEGMFNYNLRGGLSFNLSGQHLKAGDMRGSSVSSEFERFTSNLVDFMVNYPVGQKLRLRADYTLYLIDFNASQDDFRKRTDNAFAGQVFYKIMPKTEVFLAYRQINVNYDSDTLSGSTEYNFLAGVQWDITAKSRGSISAGYGLKDFNRPGIDSASTFIMEAQLNHKLREKTTLKVMALRKTNESDNQDTIYIKTNAIRGEIVEKLTERISGTIGLEYTNDEYATDSLDNRSDDLFGASVGLQYEPREWLKLNIGYSILKRDSSYNQFDFTSNNVYLRVTGSM